MPSTTWGDEEEALLQGLPWPAQLLYLRGLRRWMDYETGVVGLRRRISWQMLVEVLYVEPHQGMTGTGSPSLQQVRRLVRWLVRVGLVEERSMRDRLVFFLPQATSDQSVQKKPDSNPTVTRQPKADRHPDSDEPSCGAGEEEEPDRHPDSNPTVTRQPKADTPPVSGNTPPPITRVRARGRQRFRMSEAWEPREEQVTAHARMQGVVMSRFTATGLVEALGEFRSYWSTQDAELSREEWEQRYVKALKRLMVRNAEGGKRGTTGSSHSGLAGKDYDAGATPADDIPWLQNA